MTRLVVYVEFEIAPDKVDDFFRLVCVNAAASARDEPGCRQFDVMRDQDPARANMITLYEVYDDDAAFDAHRQTPHFKVFSDGIEGMVTGKLIRKLTVWQDGAA